MSDLNTVIAQRAELVSRYTAICDQLASTPDMYAQLEEIKAELAEMEDATVEALKAAGMPVGPFPALPTPLDVRIHVPQVKASEARTARLRWILDNQGTEGVSIVVPEGEEVSAFAAFVAETGRTAGGDAYGILSGFVRSGYCNDNGERGEEKRRFFVNTENAHVIEWLGLAS